MMNLIAFANNRLAATCSGGAFTGPCTEGISNPVLGDLGSLTGQEFFSKLLPSAIGLIFTIGVVIFFFMLLIGGVQWISSGGEKQAVENAKGRITSAVIGLLVLFSVFAIIQLVETFFGGLHILTLDIGPLKIQ